MKQPKNENPQTEPHFRSPRNISPSMLDMSLARRPSLASAHCFREWMEICDSKEYYKVLVQNSAAPPQLVRTILLLGLQTGFDLHAYYGDAGNAKAYEAEESSTQEKEKAALQSESFHRPTNAPISPVEREDK